MHKVSWLLMSFTLMCFCLFGISYSCLNVNASQLRSFSNIQGYWQHNSKIRIKGHPMDELLPGHTYTNYDELHIHSNVVDHYQKPAGQGSIIQRYTLETPDHYMPHERTFLANSRGNGIVLNLKNHNKLSTIGLPPSYYQNYYRIRHGNDSYGTRSGNRIARKHSRQYRNWINQMDKTINNDNRKKMQHVPVSVVRVFDNKMATANHKLSACINTHIPGINTKGQFEYVPKVGFMTGFQLLGDDYGKIREIVYRHSNHLKHLWVLSRKTVSELEAAPVNALLGKIADGLKPVKSISKWICTSKHLGKFGKRAAKFGLKQSVSNFIDLLSISNLTAKSMSYPYYSINRLLTPTMQRPTYSRIG